jgi:hypothetical protein
MNIHPGVVAGVGIGSGLAAGAITVAGTNRIMDQHPTGSEGDRKSSALKFAVGGVSALAAVGGAVAMHSMPVGAATAGPLLLAGGVGGVLGTVFGGLVGTARHGVGTDAKADSIIRLYDRNHDGKLDRDGSFWRAPEDTRTVRREHTYTDNHGHRHTHVYYDVYEIREFARQADVDNDRFVTRQEARDLVATYDRDGDGRLKGPELRQFERELGERRFHGHYRW